MKYMKYIDQISELILYLFTTASFVLAIYHYFNGSITTAIFWAVMCISGEIGEINLKMDKETVKEKE